jgi:hypothetical protein
MDIDGIVSLGATITLYLNDCLDQTLEQVTGQQLKEAFADMDEEITLADLNHIRELFDQWGPRDEYHKQMIDFIAGDISAVYHLGSEFVLYMK